MNSKQQHLISAFNKQFSFSELLVEEEWYGFTFCRQRNKWVACHRMGEQSNLYLVSLQGGLPKPLLPGNFFGQTGASYRFSAPVWSPDGQKIAFGVQSSNKIDSGLWLLDYPSSLPSQIYRGLIKFYVGDFSEFTQTLINKNSPDIIFSLDGKWLLFHSNYQEVAAQTNDCLGELKTYSTLLQVAIDRSQVKTRCLVKNGRVQSFTPLDHSAQALAIGVNWGQCSEVYVLEEDNLTVESLSSSPLDPDGIYAPVQVAWDKYDSELPLLVRCNNTGFAKWYRFASQTGNLSYNIAEPIILGDFDEGQLLIQPNSWLLATNEVGLGRETIWQVERTGQKQAITETQNAVHTPVTCIDSEVVFYEEKAFQPPKLLKNILGIGTVELGSCSHDRGTAQVILTDFSTEDGLRPYVQIFLPDTEPPVGGFPGIVWIKGGPISNLSRYYNFNSIELLVKQGFAVASVNYRASSGQGVAHMEAGLAQNLGIADRDDVLRTAEILANCPQVNAEKLGVWGYSWGGYLLLQAIASSNHPFICACGGGLISNWNIQQTQTEVRYYDHRLVGGYVNQLPERVKERSPIYQFTPERVKIPVLLFQGEQDIDTPVAQAQELQRAIESQVWEQSVTLKIIVGEGHDLSKNAQLQYWRESVKFFICYLKPWNFVDNPSVSQSLY